MIKVALRDIPHGIGSVLSQQFNLFNSVLEGDTTIYLLCAEHSMAELEKKINQKDQKDQGLSDHFFTPSSHPEPHHPSIIYGFAAVGITPEFHSLEAVEVDFSHRGHHYSRLLLDRVFYECSLEEKPLLMTTLSKLGQKALIESLEFLAVKYGVYVMPQDEYAEIRQGVALKS